MFLQWIRSCLGQELLASGYAEEDYDGAPRPARNAADCGAFELPRKIKPPGPDPEGKLLPMRVMPNPFNPQTRFEFVLDIPAIVRTSVLDVRGRLVVELMGGHLMSGAHSVAWNGRNDIGAAVSSGTYFVRLQVGDRTSVQKIVLTK